jgi:hypothetical protein
MTPEAVKRLLSQLSARERLDFADENWEIASALDSGVVEGAKNGDEAALQKLIHVAEKVNALQAQWAMSVALRSDKGFAQQMADADARWEAGDRETISVDDLERLLLS